MIGLRLDALNKFLQLKRDTNISLKLENPIFFTADKLSPGSVTMPFTVPGGDDSPENAAALGNPHLVESSAQYETPQASLFFNNTLLKRGLLKIREAQGNNIPSNLMFGLNTISPEFKNAKLRDVLNELIVIDSAPIEKTVYAKARKPLTSYNLEINGTIFKGTVTPVFGISLASRINDAAMEKADTEEYVPVAEIVTVGNTPLGLTPPYLKIRMAKVYTSSANVYSTDPLIPLSVREPVEDISNTQEIIREAITDLIYDGIPVWRIESNLGNYFTGFTTFLNGYINGAYPTSKFRFPLRLNKNPYSDKVSDQDQSAIKETEWVNAVGPDGLFLNNPNYGLETDLRALPQNLNSLQPFARLRYVLSAIATHFNFAWEGDFFEDEDNEEDLIDNTAMLDVPQDYVGPKKFVFWKRSFNLNELVPDVTVVDFLKGIQESYNVACYYNERTGGVRLQYRELMAKEPSYTDITSISSPKSGIEDLRLTGVRLTIEPEETDSLSVIDTYEMGIPEEDIKIRCGAIRATGNTVIDGTLITAPAVSQKIDSKFSLRLFKYAGIVDAGPFNYPGCTVGNSLLNQVNQYHKYWLHAYINRKRIKLEVAFPLRMLNAIEYEVKHRFNRSNFIIKSIDVRLTHNGIEVSDVELYTS